ncbi:MAG: hypothetical protein ACE5I3_10110 [Phycisphaerae bacterium]
MISKFLNLPAFSMLLATSLFSITLLGGCPAAQTPTVPQQEEEDQATQPPPTAPDDGLDRPISQPELDDETITSGPGDSTPPDTDDQTGDGDDGGDGDQTELVIISVQEPAELRTVRPGTIVNLVFDLLDLAGAVQSGALLLARDDDSDGQPDGDPVLILPFNIRAGSNTVSFDTNDAAHLLTNSFGRFVIGARATTVSNAVKMEYSQATLTIDGIAPTAMWRGAGPDPNSVDAEDHLVNRNINWTVQIDTTDLNSSHTVRIQLENLDGTRFDLVSTTTVPEGADTRTFTRSLLAFPKGTYIYYVTVSDGVTPPLTFYAGDNNPNIPGRPRLSVTNRLIGEFDLNDLIDRDQGGILHGFNFNDLAGSAMTGIPDIDGDGDDELIIVSRFGKPFQISDNGVGFGEAYMVYGSAQGLSGAEEPLNTVGTNIAGLPLAGIRTPIAVADTVIPGLPAQRSIAWTEGISDVTTIADMDGDDLPEIVFSFPRVESVSLQNDAATVQAPDLRPDIGGMGSAELDAFSYSSGTWFPNVSQFARGGIVIVSSHNRILKDPTRQNRKFDRLMDLHEVGQMFSPKEGGSSGMGFPDFVPYIKGSVVTADLITSCDGEDTEYDRVELLWDLIFTNQGPGGFSNPYTGRPFDDPNTSPPLSNFNFIRWTIGDLDGFVEPVDDKCEENCVLINRWFEWQGDGGYACFPCTEWDWLTQQCVGADGSNPSWHTSSFMGLESQFSVWSGFYGRATPHVGSRPDLAGARVLGQRVDDRFGTSVGSDGTWLYIGSPLHTAIRGDAVAGDDVSELPTDTRDTCGVVYQMRTDARPFPGSATSYAQLWTEPGTRTLPDPDPDDEEPAPTEPIAWPYLDVEDPNRTDWSMPVPHNYVIEDVGSMRGRDQHWEGAPGELIVTEPPDGRPLDRNDQTIRYTFEPPDSKCSIDSREDEGWLQADACATSPVYGGFVAVESAEFYVDRTPQIVGPHVGAQLGQVRALGDVNDDGIRDFAVGSANVVRDFSAPQDPNNPGGNPTVGAVFIVYGRSTGVQTANDILLERLALRRADPDRLNGVLIKGADANDLLGRAFGDAGDFNGDGFADVVVGNEGDNGNSGEIIIVFGSRTLLSPGPNTDSGDGIPGDSDGVDAFGGWTPNAVVNSLNAIHFVGENPGDLAGANVAGIGDVDNDGFADVLIAAPGAETGHKGAVYLIYGSDDFTGGEVLNLSQVGTVDLQGVKFIGRNAGDYLGGGSITFPNALNNIYLNPDQVPVTVESHGIAALGDINGDGKADYAISAMLADPLDRQNAGEVYVIYGK